MSILDHFGFKNSSKSGLASILKGYIFCSIFESQRGPKNTEKGLLFRNSLFGVILVPFWCLLGGFGEHFGRILGGFWEPFWEDSPKDIPTISPGKPKDAHGKSPGNPKEIPRTSQGNPINIAICMHMRNHGAFRYGLAPHVDHF